MKHLGSVTDIYGDDIEPVDIITFGSPCQDMSVAGKRAGMQHSAKGDEGTTRSGLFFEAIRIIREMRVKTNGEYPKYAIWENVQGAFTSNKGEDFKCVLEELYAFCTDEKEFSIPRPERKWESSGEIVGDRGSIAWRTLDAQYWGVPQRRKRIYLVADFDSDRAGKILFERDCLLRDSAQGGKEGKETSSNVGGSAERGCISFAWTNSANAGLSDTVECSSILKASGCPAVVYDTTQITCPTSHSNPKIGDPCHTLAAQQHPPLVVRKTDCSFESVASFMGGQGAKAGGIGYSESVSPTIKSVMSGGNTVPDIVYPINCSAFVYDCRGNGDGDVVPTLTGDHENRVTDYTAVCVTEKDVDDKVTAVTLHGDHVSGTLMARDYKGAGRWDTLGSIICMATGQTNAEILENCSPTLTCGNEQPIVAHNSKPPRRYIVRRLVPIECAKLQGFPDWWGIPDYKTEMTDDELSFWNEVRRIHALVNGKKYKKFYDDALLKWYNKLHTDSAEYKMWGNGIALPCAEYVVGGVVEAIMSDSQ